jgi:glycosyltransferase involved in cell wall biosynthesis
MCWSSRWLIQALPRTNGARADPMSPEPLVSVVIPIYNGMPYIVDAVASVLAQSHRQLELILVDDGSSDGSLDQIRACSDPRIRWLSQANSGTAAARNQGIHLGRGDLLAFLDQDDLWLPDKLRIQVEAMTADPGLDLVLGHIWQGCFPTDSKPATCLANRTGRRLAGYLPSTLLARRSLFKAVGDFREDQRLAESFEWFVRVRDRGFREHLLPEILSIRRVHPANKSLSLSSWRGEYARVLAESLRRRRSCADAEAPQASQTGSEMATKPPSDLQPGAIGPSPEPPRS